MQARVFIPLIDMAFLSLGAVVAILSQTQLIRSLPIEITEIGRGIAAISREEVTVITIAHDGLYVDGDPVDLDALGGAVDGDLALVRADRQVPTERLVGVLAVLAAEGVEIRIEVEEQRAP